MPFAGQRQRSVKPRLDACRLCEQSLIGQSLRKIRRCRDNVANFGGTLAGSEEVRGKVEAGLKGTLPGGVSLEFSGAYDGIGSDTFRAIGARASVRVPLN